MTLSVGEQLFDSHGVAYTVTALRRQTDWYVLCEADRGFLNYRYREREFYAAGPDERLPVLLRCPCYPEHDAETADALGELLVFEATQVLSLPGARWFPEPIDLLPLPAPRSDALASPAAPLGAEAPQGERAGQTRAESSSREQPSAARGSVLAMVRPHGDALSTWCARMGKETLGARLRCACEGLELLQSIHRQGLLLGCFDPRDLLVDPHGRLYYLGADRIVRQDRMPRLRRFFPPERFFRPWAAPEAIDGQGWLDERSDFYSWAAMTAWLLAPRPGVPLGDTADAAEPLEPYDVAFDPRKIDPGDLREALASAAADAWMECLTGCLNPDPQRRPASIELLQGRSGSGSRAGRARRNWRRLFGR